MATVHGTMLENMFVIEWNIEEL